MDEAPFLLEPGRLDLDALRELGKSRRKLALDPEVPRRRSTAPRRWCSRSSTASEVAYGINTGFGSLAHTRIPDDQVAELQRRLVLSHAAGIGPALADEIVRLILILKINALARGFSGIRRSVIEALLKLLNAEVYPVIPSKGSVGASGDLAPLAHLSAVLLGIGAVRHEGRTLSAVEGLDHRRPAADHPGRRRKGWRCSTAPRSRPPSPPPACSPRRMSLSPPWSPAR